MKLWTDIFKPIVVLGVICAATSALLAVTNNVTAPIIEENAAAVADKTRAALLPSADSFTQMETSVEGVTEMYEAQNGSGYVISAAAKGYGGEVPVMVAFDADGKIVAVNFLSNSETPGLGQKIRADKFQDQFADRDAQPIALSDIDAISGATISSGAAVAAINAAVAAYDEVAGVERIDLTALTEDEVYERVLPEHGELVVLEGTPTKTMKAANGGMIVYGEAPGFYKKTLTAVVGFDASGVITGVWFNALEETEGLGDQVGKSEEFAAQFIGKSGSAQVDAIAGATTSSKAAMQAVDNAIKAYEAGKGA